MIFLKTINNNSAERLKDNPNINFILFGTGGLKEKFVDMVSSLGLSNVKFFPLQPYDRVSHVYSLADIGIVSCKKGIGHGAMPSKTWSILSAGTPVVANYDKGTDIENILLENQIGLFSDAGDIDAFVDAILYMQQNPELCAEMGRKGRAFIEQNLTKEIGTSKIIGVVEQIKANIL